MVDYDPNGGTLGMPDKRKNSRTSSGSLLATPVNYTSVGSVRTRLAAINGSYWTTSRLNSCTLNDLLYALRLADDTAGM